MWGIHILPEMVYVAYRIVDMIGLFISLLAFLYELVDGFGLGLVVRTSSWISSLNPVMVAQMGISQDCEW